MEWSPYWRQGRSLLACSRCMSLIYSLDRNREIRMCFTNWSLETEAKPSRMCWEDSGIDHEVRARWKLAAKIMTFSSYWHFQVRKQFQKGLDQEENWKKKSVFNQLGKTQTFVFEMVTDYNNAGYSSQCILEMSLHRLKDILHSQQMGILQRVRLENRAPSEGHHWGNRVMDYPVSWFLVDFLA